MRTIMTIIAIILILLGATSMLTPMPGATLLLAVGFSLLICSSPTAEIWLSRRRERSHKFNRIMVWVEDHVGKSLGSILRQTRPKDISK